MAERVAHKNQPLIYHPERGGQFTLSEHGPQKSNGLCVMVLIGLEFLHLDVLLPRTPLRVGGGSLENLPVSTVICINE